MREFYQLLVRFMSYPKTDDLTLDFFNFLQTNYPTIWEELNKFYADDYSWEEIREDHPYRIHLSGWTSIVQPGNFDLFLPAFKSIWLTLTNQDYGKCAYCGEDAYLNVEHQIVASYEYAPKIKFYEAMEMDASIEVEQIVCRKCAVSHLKILAAKIDDEKLQCFV